LGYFPNLLKVPSDVISHVRAQVGIDGDVPAVHDAQATAKWHRGLIRERLGVKYQPSEVRALVVTVLREACTVPKLDAWPPEQVFSGRARRLAGTH
jgi:hypothetical protein